MAFLALAIISGGKSFRWFGDNVKDVSYSLGEVADLFNQASEDIKSASHTIRQTGTKLMNIAEETGEKASDIVNATTEKASGIANATGEMMGEIRNTVSAEDNEITDSKSERKRKRTATKNAKDE